MCIKCSAKKNAMMGNQLKLEYATNGKGYELQTPEKIAVDTATIFKPIQYLGANESAG